MKKLKHLAFVVSAFMLVSFPSFAAKAAKASTSNSGICELINQFKGVFQVLRTMAFVGAAFVLAKYAWDLISKGWGGSDGKGDLVTSLKGKLLPMVVGFIILFAIGALLTGLLNGHVVDCKDVLTKPW